MNTFSIGVTLITAFFAFAWRIIAKTKLKKSYNDIAFTIIVEFFASLTCLLFIFFTGLSFPLNFTFILLFLSSMVLGGLCDYLILFSSKNADIADSSILLPLNNLYLVLLASFFLGEAMTFSKLLAVILIVIGSILALTKNYRLVINRGIAAVFIYGWMYSGIILIDKKISSNFSIALYGGLSYLLSSVFLFIMLRKNRFKTIFKEWKTNNLWSAIIGIMWGLFSISLLFAYRYGDASKIIPFMRIFIVATTLYSIFILKEKDRMVQKIFGSVVVTAGALLLAYV